MIARQVLGRIVRSIQVSQLACHFRGINDPGQLMLLRVSFLEW
jgi:hypothetical protein